MSVTIRVDPETLAIGKHARLSYGGRAGGGGETIRLGEGEVSLREFLRIVRLALTLSDLREQDIRLVFLEALKQARVVAGLQGRTRLEIPSWGE